MDIEINGKEYNFNNNMRLGVLMRLQEDSNDLKNLRFFIKELLIPTPTAKELYNVRENDLILISEKYEEFQKKKNAKIKKKRSL